MKRFLILITTLVLVFVTLKPTTVSAYEEIEPRASYYYCATCDSNKEVVSTPYEYTEWVTTSTVTCQHGYDHGTDSNQYRYRYNTVKLQCGHSFRTGTKVKQTRTQCNGFD